MNVIQFDWEKVKKKIIWLTFQSIWMRIKNIWMNLSQIWLRLTETKKILSQMSFKLTENHFWPKNTPIYRKSP
jgi:hypothetical protein